MRETWEEVGLDLCDSSRFNYLGGFPEVNCYKHTTWKRNLFLSAHVFLQTSHENLYLNLEPREVDSYRWVSFENFTHNFDAISKPKHTVIPDLLVRRMSHLFNYKSKQKVYCSVPGAVLPLHPEYDSYDYSRINSPDDSSEYHLWGITYRRLRSLIFLIPENDRETNIRQWVHFSMSFPYYTVSKILEMADLYLFGDEVSIRHYYWVSLSSLCFLGLFGSFLTVKLLN